MGETATRQPRVKVPRRTIYFASGETMEEYSTDEEEEEEEERAKKDVVTVDSVGRDQKVQVFFPETETWSDVGAVGSKAFSFCFLNLTKYEWRST